jgi:hypothetical protein
MNRYSGQANWIFAVVLILVSGPFNDLKPIPQVVAGETGICFGPRLLFGRRPARLLSFTLAGLLSPFLIERGRSSCGKKLAVRALTPFFRVIND